MYFPWSGFFHLGPVHERSSGGGSAAAAMTTTTLAGVTTEGGGGGHTTTPVAGSSPPNLILPPPSNRMMMPLTSRLPTGGDEGIQEERHHHTTNAQESDMRPPLLIDVAIRCTTPNCSCDCFTPCKIQIRTCGGCGHGWVSHALDKLGFTHLLNCHQVELVQPSIAFDVASLMLYGTQAIPIRLKILLDRLFSVLRRDEVLQVLHGFGWTNEDYTRGYILQDQSGRVMERWLMASREEEPLILQQFLRFGETKHIAQQLLLQESCEKPEFVVQSARTESDIKKFIERTKRSSSSSVVVPNSVPLKHTTYSTHAYSVSTASLPATGKAVTRQTSSSMSSTHSMSPSAVSPVNNCGSPATLSPLNRLQNMQPYDYRRERSTPEEKVNDGAMATSVPYRSPSSSPGASTLAVSTSSATSVNLTSDVTRPGVTSPNFSGTDAGFSDDDSSSAINLTRSSSTTTGYLDSVFAARKVRHLRKSANPMKRRWNTMILSTLSTNPATGKKRVQCHVCLKTFCDKGALKIHFSAVHLREMHKCTVEGCNMMFSSRRSRNRHSANPNPKLHTPNYRRKINPHDGRSANPYPVIPPGGIPGFHNPLLTGAIPNHIDGDTDDVEIDNTHVIAGRPADIRPGIEDIRQQVEDRNHNSMSSEPVEINDNLPLSLTKKQRTDYVDADESDDKQEGMDLSMKENRSSSSKGVRKRKSLNPTKCQVNSDDDLQYVSTDDSSSDTYIDQDNDENGIMDSKSDYLSSDGLDDSKDGDDEDIGRQNSQPETAKKDFNRVTSSSPPPQCPPLISTTKGISTSTVSTPSVPKYVNAMQNGFISLDSSPAKEGDTKCAARDNEDISENPLRHLESLSLGSFSNLMSNRTNVSKNSHGSSGVSYHAPGLGLGSSATTTTASRSETPPPPHLSHNEQASHLFNHSPSSLISPPSLQHVSGGGHASSDPESSLQDQQMPLLPVYRDASIVGAVEIPVDKENPRRCTACGKIFQNHFGVKTHYQNVHLKLMHKCTVEGCNAAFPSKRSRDRHSANLNLHRKLLSTTSDKQPPYFDKSSIYSYHADAALRGDFFARLYDPQALPLSFADLYHTRLPPDSGYLRSQYPGHLMPGFHPAFMLPPNTTTAPVSTRHHVNDDLGSGKDSPISSVSSPVSSPRPQDSPPQRDQSLKLEEDLKPDPEGRYSCDICEKKFHENIVLREHYEKCHARELLRCADDQCNKAFLSGRTRSLHTDEMHKDKIIEAS